MSPIASLILNLTLFCGLPLIIFIVLACVRQIIVMEHERGILYQNGKIRRILEPGRHWYFQFLHSVSKLDMRIRVVTIPGQEVLSADNVSLKISLVASFKIQDPIRLLTQTTNYLESLYSSLQLQLRDLVGDTPVEALLSKRKELNGLLLESVQPQATEIGIDLISVGVRDIMFPGELKNIFAQVVNARNEGLAALERARGESAALRNLANTAKLLDNNPSLLQLRLLQSLNASSGNTIVLNLPNSNEGHSPIIVQKPSDPAKD